MCPATSPTVVLVARGNGGGRPGKLTTCLHDTSLVVCQSSNVKRTTTPFSKWMLRTSTVPRSVGGRVRGSVTVSRKMLASGDGCGFGIGDVTPGEVSTSCMS